MAEDTLIFQKIQESLAKLTLSNDSLKDFLSKQSDPSNFNNRNDQEKNKGSNWLSILGNYFSFKKNVSRSEENHHKKLAQIYDRITHVSSIARSIDDMRISFLDRMDMQIYHTEKISREIKKLRQDISDQDENKQRASLFKKILPSNKTKHTKDQPIKNDYSGLLKLMPLLAALSHFMTAEIAPWQGTLDLLGKLGAKLLPFAKLTFIELGENVLNLVKWPYSYLEKNIPILKNWLTTTKENLLKKASLVTDTIKNSQIFKTLEEKLIIPLKGFFSSMFDNVKTGIDSFLKKILSLNELPIIKNIKTFFINLTERTSTLLNRVSSFLKFDKIRSFVTGITESVSGLFARLGNALNFGGIAEKISKIKIPSLGNFFKGGGWMSSLFKGGIGIKFLSKLPVIGTLITLYFAYDRFKKGDITGGLLEMASALVVNIPIAGTALSIGLSMLNAWRDGSGETQKSIIDRKQGKGIWASIGKFYNNIADKVYDWPYIGSTIRAIDHFTNDRWKEGFASLATAIPIIGDLVSFFFDETETRDENVGAIRKPLWSKAYDYLKEMLLSIPGVGTLLSAIDDFSEGNFKEGFKKITPSWLWNNSDLKNNNLSPGKLNTPDNVTKVGQNQPQLTQVIKIEASELKQITDVLVDISKREMEMMAIQNNILEKNNEILYFISQNLNKKTINVPNIGDTSIRMIDNYSLTKKNYIDSTRVITDLTRS
jgi:hypothetical protein